MVREMADSIGGALTNIAGIEKPATTLIERVSDAVGGLARPWQIRRVARAEAEGEIIRAQARLAISEMEERALQRMIREEGKKQENMEEITRKAIPLLAADAQPEKMETDWISNFFDRCRLISDTDMQALWGRILASEANSPGTVSKKTVEIVSTLDKLDAEYFTKICAFMWRMPTPALILPDLEHEVMLDLSLSFEMLSHLDDIGLLSFQPVTGFQRNNITGPIVMSYFSRDVVFSLPAHMIALPIGNALFTKSGRQLAAFCGAQPSEVYFAKMMDDWSKAGINTRII